MSVFWAIMFHWSVNISGAGVARVFPDIQGRGYPNVPDGWENLVMVLVTVAVFALVGRERLKRQLEDDMATLHEEALNDRP